MYKLLFLTIFFYVITPIVFAHETGPSYMLVNGKSTLLNIAHAFAHNPGFTLGTDLAPEEKYLVGTPVRFKIDEKNFYTPDASPAHFRWDFQDGTEPVEGSEVSHTFKEAGSYFIALYARYNATSPYTNADILQINIAGANEPVPIAKIMVDGKLVTDFKNKQQIISNQEITFDASKSIGENLRYYWELGDGTKSRDKTITHVYTGTGENTYFPILHVVDDQNLSDDSIITLVTSTTTPNPVQTTSVFSDFFGSVFRAIAKLFGRS